MMKTGPKSKWSVKEIDILKDNYWKLGPKELSETRLIDKTISSIRGKAWNLGIQVKKEEKCRKMSIRQKERFANPKARKELSESLIKIKLDDKKDFILDLYLNKKNSLDKIRRIIGTKSYGPIARHLKKWNIKKRIIDSSGAREWTNDELQYLKNNYWMDEKKNLINETHHSFSGIMHKAKRIGLKRNLNYFRSKYTREFNLRDNPSKRPEVREKHRKRMLKFINEHPDKILNRILRRNHITSLEKRVKRILDKHNLSYKYNHYVKTKMSYKFPDFRIGKLIIECDGKQFHQDTQKDTLRDRELINMGYELLHFSEDKINKNIETVERCILYKLEELNLLQPNKLVGQYG